MSEGDPLFHSFQLQVERLLENAYGDALRSAELKCLEANEDDIKRSARALTRARIAEWPQEYRTALTDLENRLGNA